MKARKETHEEDEQENNRIQRFQVCRPGVAPVFQQLHDNEEIQ